MENEGTQNTSHDQTQDYSTDNHSHSVDSSSDAVDATEPGEETQQNSGKQGRTYNEDEVKDIVKARLERDRKVQAQKAAEKAAEDNKKWEELANTRKTRIEELEPKAERVETLEGVLQKYVDTEREGLPRHILTLLDKMPVEEQLSYITENRAELKPQSEEEQVSQRRTAPDATRQTRGLTGYDKEKASFNQMLRQRGLRK